MEQFLMNAFMFILSAFTLVAAWVGVSASRRGEVLDAKIDAKIAQQAVFKRMNMQTAAHSAPVENKQHQTI